MNNEEYKKYQQQLQLGRRIWLEYQKPRKGDTADIEQTVQALMKSPEEKEKEKEREAQVYHQQLEQKEREKEQEIRRYRHQLQEKDREHQVVLQEKDREHQVVLQEKDRELRQSQEAVRRYQQQALTDDHWVINKDEVTSSIQEWKNIAGEVIPSVHYYIPNDEIIHFILCRRE